MAKTPDFDVAAAHRYFAADCFNKAWDLIEKPDRTPEDDRLMVALNQASIFHWLNRPDCDDSRLSVGYWQASRIHALLGNAPEARRHAEICLGYSRRLEPFFLGYAYEALARAAAASGDAGAASGYLERAKEQALLVPGDEDRELLLNDLAALR